MAPQTQELSAPPARLETLLEVSRQLSRIQPLESLLSNVAEACGVARHEKAREFGPAAFQLSDAGRVGLRLASATRRR